MSTLEQVMKNKSGPYNMPVRIQVVATDNVTNYGTENKQLKNCAIADQTTCVKAVCFDPQKFQYIDEGIGLVLRNVILKPSEIVITKQSRLFLTKPPDVSEELCQQGKFLLFPPAPPCINIKDAKTSPKKQRISVKGRVTNEGIATVVGLNDNKQIDVKTITLADSTDDVKVTLWREKSKSEIHPGDYITVTHVVVNQYNDEINLNTTQYSKIEVMDAPDERAEYTILGYIEIDDDKLEVITEENGTFSIAKDLFDQNLHENDLPKKVNVSVNGTTIKSVF